MNEVTKEKEMLVGFGIGKIIIAICICFIPIFSGDMISFIILSVPIAILIMCLGITTIINALNHKLEE